MGRQQIAAIVATCVLSLLMVFQILLAVGLPLGRAAWGGANRVLPTMLRWASLGAVLILGVAVWMVLARVGFIAFGAGLARVLTWVFAAYFTLNIVMNILSDSPIERTAMTPVSVVLVICFVLASLAK